MLSTSNTSLRVYLFVYLCESGLGALTPTHTHNLMQASSAPCEHTHTHESMHAHPHAHSLEKNETLQSAMNKVLLKHPPHDN